MIRILEELSSHTRPREALLDRAFGPRRRRKTSERLREGRWPAEGLAFSALDERGDLVGTVRLWEIEAGTAGPALLLGPLAVAPAARGRGLGTAMMTHAIGKARDLRRRAILLVGDPSFYGRFGFTKVEGLALPGPVDPERFLALELEPGALSGATGIVTPRGRLIEAQPATRARQRA